MNDIELCEKIFDTRLHNQRPDEDLREFERYLFEHATPKRDTKTPSIPGFRSVNRNEINLAVKNIMGENTDILFNIKEFGNPHFEIVIGPNKIDEEMDIAALIRGRADGAPRLDGRLILEANGAVLAEIQTSELVLSRGWILGDRNTHINLEALDWALLENVVIFRSFFVQQA